MAEYILVAVLMMNGSELEYNEEFTTKAECETTARCILRLKGLTVKSLHCTEIDYD